MTKDWRDFPDFDARFYGGGVEIPNVWADWGWRDWLPILAWAIPAALFVGGVWLAEKVRGE